MPSLSYTHETSFETDADASTSQLRVHGMPATPSEGQQYDVRGDLEASLPAADMGAPGSSRTRKRARSTEKSNEQMLSSDEDDFDNDDPAIHDKENTPSPSPARSVESRMNFESRQILTPSRRLRTQAGFLPPSPQRAPSASPNRAGSNVNAASPLRQSSTPSSMNSSAEEERAQATTRATRSSPRRSRVDHVVFSLDKHVEGEERAQPRIEGEDAEMA